MTTITDQYEIAPIPRQRPFGAGTACASVSELQRAHILVADDDPRDLGLFADALGSDGYAVTAVASGHQAVEYYKTHYRIVDVVVLDMGMRDLNGLDVLYHMKRTHNSVRVILTASIAGLSVREMIVHGAWALLIKPFSKAELKRRIEQCLRK